MSKRDDVFCCIISKYFTAMDNKAKIEELIADREKFNSFVYTPLCEAVIELEKRLGNKKLVKYVQKKLQVHVPEVLKLKKTAVFARPIATPNYELHRFICIADILDGFQPLIWEYTDSKFVPQNESKYFLARMGFYFGLGKKGGPKITYLNAININDFSGKKMNEIKMPCGKAFKDFHHEILSHVYEKKNLGNFVFDGSDWYKNHGASAEKYYKKYLALFLQNAILFENFMLDYKEISFTREIFLPALMKIQQETGYKPLIVALEPTEIEGDNFWMSYPGILMKIVREKLNLI